MEPFGRIIINSLNFFNIVHTEDKHKHFHIRVGIGMHNRKQRSRVVSEDKLQNGIKSSYYLNIAIFY